MGEASVLRWSLLIGGLIIIADLGTLVIQQRIAAGPDVLNALDIADQVVSILLYSLVGVAVQRETGRVYLGGLAGLLAGLLDGIVLAAAASLAPRPGDEANTPEMQLLWNVIEGALLAAVSAWFSTLARRRAGR